jgi:hypothetical protein
MIHPKAMPVILTTKAEINAWLTAEGDAALTLQRPLPDGALMIVARVRSNWRSSRRSPFLNRAEPRQGHRYFDCRRKCSLTFSPDPPAACIGQNHSPEGTG